MTNLNKKIAAVTLGAALTVTGLLGGIMLNNSTTAASAEENDVPSCMVASSDVSTIAEHNVSMPSYGGYTQFNCVVGYKVYQNDSHASILQFKTTESAQYQSFEMSCTDWQYYVVASSTSSTTCTPTAKVFRAYCSSCRNYSSYCTGLRSVSANSSYAITGKTAASDTITTSYLSFSQTSDSTSIYKFSIAYNGAVGDGKVSTSGSSSTTTVTVNGITFTVNANSSRIRIKATSTVECNSYDTMFAYTLIS